MYRLSFLIFLPIGANASKSKEKRNQKHAQV
jgi:hypothetical protein